VMVSGRDPAEVRALRLALTRRGDVVLDSLLGSGSTLLAAEEIGRICIGIELDPEYVDFAIRRWQHRTGKDAVEVVSGEAFDALADRRPDGAIKDQADASGSGLDETPGDDREDRSHD